MFDECLYTRSPIFNSFSDPSDSSIDSLLQEFSEEPTANSTILEKFGSGSVYERTHFSNSSGFSDGCVDYPVSSVKTEDLPLDLDSSQDCFFRGTETMRPSERSYSSYNDGDNPWILFQPRFFYGLFLSSENGFPDIPQMTRDLPEVENNHQRNVECERNSSAATNLMQEGKLKVGRYNAEERKERIDRYKAKRTLRNFNKTIKYACRKTLADSRARVRGRFARNDEPDDMPKLAPSSIPYDDNNILFSSWYEVEDSGVTTNRGGDIGGSAGGCCGGGRGQLTNYQFGHYFGY